MARIRSNVSLWILAGISTSAVACLPFVPETTLDAKTPVFVNTLMLQAIFISVALGGAAVSKTPLRKRLALTYPRLATARLGLVLLGMLGVSEALEALVQLGGWADSGSIGAFRTATSGLRGAELGVGLLSLAVAPAFGEELFFRGLLQRGTQTALGPWGSLGLAALAFGAAHLDPIQGPAAVVLGLYLGGVLLRTKSLWPPILCHALNNTLAVLLSAYAIDLGERPIWLIPCGLFLAAVGLLAAQPRSEPNDEPYSKQPVTPSR